MQRKKKEKTLRSTTIDGAKAGGKEPKSGAEGGTPSFVQLLGGRVERGKLEVLEGADPVLPKAWATMRKEGRRG